MKAVVLSSPRAPLEVLDVPVPVPKTGQVLVKIEACGICHSDLFLANSPKLPHLPLILGHEGIGVVEELGPGVESLKRGDRVGIAFLHSACGACDYCDSGRETYCLKQVQTGYHVDGALAEYAVGSARHVARIPNGLSILQAAPMCCAGLTAYKALKTAALRPGEWVAIFGVGGLGHLAIQLARRSGLRVAVSDIVPEKLQQAVDLGAELVVNSKVQVPKGALAPHGGAAAAITFTDSPIAVEQAFQTLKPGGILVLVGLSLKPFALPVLPTVLQGMRVAGSFVGTHQELQEIIDLAASGTPHVQVETCRLEDVPGMLERMKEGKILGRAVVEF